MTVVVEVLIHSDGPALWPSWYPVEFLETAKQRDPVAFAALYQQSPVPPGGAIFREEWWQRYADLPPLVRTIIAVDAAFKTGVRNDFSAFALWGRSADGNVYLVDVWRGRWEFPDLDANLDQTTARWEHLRPIPVVEDAASGQSLIQSRRRANKPVISHKVRAGASKESRMEAVTPHIRAGLVHIPPRATWLDDWLLEHNRAPAGQHDDQVDTTVIALEELLGMPQLPVLPPDTPFVDRDVQPPQPLTPLRQKLKEAKERRELEDLEQWRARGLDI